MLGWDSNASCTGSPHDKCGGAGALSALSITSCPGNAAATEPPAPWLAAAPPPPPLQQCGSSGCTSCPAGDTCCQGKAPDSYKVPGGYGCSPPAKLAQGCASGGFGKNAGLPDGRCCCGMGPGVISTSLPNVLVIGDSVSDGYIPFVARALNGTANAQCAPRPPPNPSAWRRDDYWLFAGTGQTMLVVGAPTALATVRSARSTSSAPHATSCPPGTSSPSCVPPSPPALHILCSA